MLGLVARESCSLLRRDRSQTFVPGTFYTLSGSASPSVSMDRVPRYLGKDGTSDPHVQPEHQPLGLIPTHLFSCQLTDLVARTLDRPPTRGFLRINTS